MAKKDKKTEKQPLYFRFWARIVKIFYRKRKVEGLENLPEEPCVIVANHSQLHSPLSFELFVPFPRVIWCDSKMMERAEVPQYAEDNFWRDASEKQKKRRRFWVKKIARLVGYIFTNAHTLPVYRDARIMQTFRLTEQALLAGKNVVIFPESDVKNPDNNILFDFNLYFTDIAKIYHKKYGKILTFVPVYNCVEQRKIIIGKNHVKYNPDIKMDEQRKLLCDSLTKEITDIALSLPRHKVVQFLPSEHDVYSKDE